MHRNAVELDDAVAVILLMESSVASTFSSSFNHLFKDPTTTVFPDEDGTADREFILDEKNVLEKYELLEYLTPHEANAIEEYNTGTTQRMLLDGEISKQIYLCPLPLRILSAVPVGNNNGQLQILWSLHKISTTCMDDTLKRQHRIHILHSPPNVYEKPWYRHKIPIRMVL